MSDAIRQSKLFAAEDWKVVAQSFRNAEFKSYDFDTLREAMLDILRRNYPEDFNDYIQSSEFIALIDLVSFVGQNLSFRNDLNSREAFLDTAERRDSILKLARQLSYQPKRSQNAIGYLKIKSITTTESVLDSLGNDLARQPVYWAAATDTDAYERFVLVMNAALNPAAQFGAPEITTSVQGTITAQYGLNSSFADFPTSPFVVDLFGNMTSFELTSPSLTSQGVVEENTPHINGPLNIIYKNDGRGNLSVNTGFFVLFKQGTIRYYDFNIETPLINRVIDIPTINVTENDVWVYHIDESGNMIPGKEWQRVAATSGSNLYLNDAGNNERNIYEVLTGNDDQISIKFADGKFGNIPLGLIRVVVRTGNGDSYSIKPSDIRNITFPIPYTSRINQPQLLTISCDLEYTITNAETADSIDDIRDKAPSYYYAQDRMITGQDYATYPMTVSPGILKIKSINRIHSGMSRYLQDKDPTGTYNDLDVFGTDGFVYREDVVIRNEYIYPYGLKKISDVILDMEKLLSDQDVINFYYKNYPDITLPNTLNTLTAPGSPSSIIISFQKTGQGTNYCHGYFTNPGAGEGPIGPILRIGGSSSSDYTRQLRHGAIMLIEDETVPIEHLDRLRWVPMGRIYGNGLGVQDELGNNTGLKESGEGVVLLNKIVPSGSKVIKIIPAMAKSFTEEILQTIRVLMSEFYSFGIAYDHINYSYRIINADNLNIGEFSLVNAGSLSGAGLDSSWLMYLTYESGRYVVRQRGTSLIVGSSRKVRFYNENFINTLETTKIDNSNDTMRFVNNRSAANPLVYDQFEPVFRFIGYYRYDDGYTDSTKVKCGTADQDTNFVPLSPRNFENLVGTSTISLGWKEEGGVRIEVPVNPLLNEVSRVVSGRKDLRFQWHHIAPKNQTIDPSPTNIIDTYVLLEGYYNEYKYWIRTGAKKEDVPERPTSDSLAQRFLSLNSHKSISDEIIFHPGKLLNLFGILADSRYRGSLKVVKMPGARINENEIKSRILSAMDEYFHPSNWGFGEIFYYTELAAFIHKKLAGNIASVVIVPTVEASRFGNLFQIKPAEDEVFFNVATADDIELISSITETNIRVNN